MKLRPLGDRVVLKRAEPEKMTKGGIYIPDTAADKPLEAEVVAVGPGLTKDEETDKPKLKVGDRVLLRKWAGNEVKLNGEEHVIVREEDILAVVNR